MWFQKKTSDALLNQYKKINENIKRGQEVQIVSEVKIIERNIDYKLEYQKTLKELNRYKKMYDKERNINKVVNSDEEYEEDRVEKEIKNILNDIVNNVVKENKPKPPPAPKVKEFHELSWKEMKVVLKEMNISQDELDDISDNNYSIESRKKCAIQWFNKKTNKIATFNEEEHQPLIIRMNNAKRLLIQKEFEDRHMNMFLNGVNTYYNDNDDSDEVVKYVDNYFIELLKHSPSQEITDTFMDRYKKRLTTFH